MVSMILMHLTTATTRKFTSLAGLKEYTTLNESENCALRVM